MADGSLPSLRLAACREACGDGKEWSFYLINDGQLILKWATLVEARYEYAGQETTEQVNARDTALRPATFALMWRADGDGAEFRQNQLLEFATEADEGSVLFEFPRLYRKREFALVSGLDKPGWDAYAKWRLTNP